MDSLTRDVMPTAAGDLTERQRSVVTVVERYVAAAGEMPSAAWVGRQLGITKRRAWEHVDTLRRRGWFRSTGRGV